MSKVVVQDHWRQYAREAERATVKSLVEAAAVATAVGKSKPSRYDIPDIQGETDMLPPARVPGGWLLVISWKDFRAHWFDKGTYQKLGGTYLSRARKYEQRYKAAVARLSGNRGIKPVRFTTAARRAGQVALLRALYRNFK